MKDLVMVWEISGPGAFGRAPHPTCFGLLLSGVGSDMVIPQVLLIGLRGFPHWIFRPWARWDMSLGVRGVIRGDFLTILQRC